VGTFLAIGLLPIAFAALIAAITWWLLYYVIKSAIKNGLSEARIRWPMNNNLSSTPPSNAPSGYRWVLVPEDAMPHAAQPLHDMRAD